MCGYEDRAAVLPADPVPDGLDLLGGGALLRPAAQVFPDVAEDW